ncbi:outer membrane protein transport protein [bacterium]|nr:outer membrane protein transport protein [bacterium]MBU1983628.1 outer membrane protein transport protein [bacterium]
MKLTATLAAMLILCNLAASQAKIPEQLLLSTGQYVGSAARPLGLAGTYTGIADDYSSIWWNPAGLAQVKRIEVQASISRSALQNKAEYYGVSREGTSSNFRLNNLGIVFPVPVYQGAMSFAFGYTQVYGFDGAKELSSFVPSRVDAPFWDTYNALMSGRLGLWSLAGAVDVTPNLALGMGINYWTGPVDFSRTTTYRDETGSHYSEWTLTTDLSAWGANFGGLFRLGRFARIGAMLQTPLSTKISEEWTYNGSFGYDDYRMTYPAVFRFGASFAQARWLLAADVEMRDWTAMEFRSDTPYKVNGVPVSRASANQQIKDDYQNTVRLSMGGEYLFPAYGLRLRGGYAFEPNNYKPLGDDADRHLFSFGVGVLVDRSVMIDAGLQFTGFSRKTTDGSPTGLVNEDISSTTALVTLSYRM